MTRRNLLAEAVAGFRARAVCEFQGGDALASCELHEFQLERTAFAACDGYVAAAGKNLAGRVCCACG